MSNASELPANVHLGRYELLARLSSGGMAEIFLGCVVGPGGFRKFVTLKRILPHLRRDAEFVKMFLDEARISAALSHANIAQVFDLVNDEGELCIAMEFIAGQDLRQLWRAAIMKEKPIPVGLACMLMRDVCHALRHAHEFVDPLGVPQPVVHRDIAPKNIMLSYSGNVKVIDFGIAKARGALGDTDAGRIKGSAAYMSPEQVRGEPLDGRSDLFSAGVVLHELLTGRRLFQADNPQATIYRLLQMEIPTPRSLVAEVPEALSQVVMRALARRLEDRFSSAKQMAKAIEEAFPQAFDEERASAYVRTVCADAVEQTRHLLQFSGPETDLAALKVAAGALDEAKVSLGSSVELRRISPDDEPTQAEPAAVASAGVAFAPLGFSPTSKTVLAVDDSPSLLLLLKADLVAGGYRVVSCDSATGALRLLEAEKPDLIILDVMMPEMDGFELCRRIREGATGRYTPILFVSGACSLEERVRGLSVGADDFIRKPYEPADLLARVRLQIQRTEMQKARQAPGSGSA